MRAVQLAALGCQWVLAGGLLAPLAGAQAQATLPTGNARSVAAEKVTEEKFSGDFDRMIARRRIRVVVPYSRTLYFNDKGTHRGLTADLLREFEQHLNRKYAKQIGKRPLTIIAVPTTRDELINDVSQGFADIATGNLSVTETRLKQVDFAYLPELPGANEVIAIGPKSPPLNSVDDLAGKTIHIRKLVSYRETIEQLNERFTREGKPPMRIIDLPDELEDEDKLEMLSVGLLQIVVIDDWKGKIWAQILKGVTVRDDLLLKKDLKIGWAIRKNSPALKVEIEEFMRKAQKTASLDYRKQLALTRAKQFRNNTTDAEMKRFQDTIALFEKYGTRYRFDPLMLAAQGYQESQLRQDAKSRVGAIGIMQLMPATGAELKVGDIRIAEANIHAGAKYMDILMTKYFPNAKFSDANRPLFAFASYNAGPGRIAQMRKEAERRGLDPDRWFNNVEVVTAEKVGIETTTYVRNIYKYYVAYKLSTEAIAEQQRARDSVLKNTK